MEIFCNVNNSRAQKQRVRVGVAASFQTSASYKETHKHSHMHKLPQRNHRPLQRPSSNMDSSVLHNLHLQGKAGTHTHTNGAWDPRTVRVHVWTVCVKTNWETRTHHDASERKGKFFKFSAAAWRALSGTWFNDLGFARLTIASLSQSWVSNNGNPS